MDFLENSRSDFIRNCFFRHHRHVCMQCIYATSQTEQAKSGKGEDLGMPSMLWFNTSVAFGFLYLFIVTIDSKEYDCCLNNMCSFLKGMLIFFLFIATDFRVRTLISNGRSDVLKVIGFVGKQNYCSPQWIYWKRK